MGDMLMRLFLEQQPHTFDPETVQILCEALDEAWQHVQTVPDIPHNVVAREALAKCTVDAAKEGETDRRKLIDMALARFRL